MTKNVFFKTLIVIKKQVFRNFRGFLGVKKFFWRRIRVFQPFLPLEMMFFEKFWEKILFRKNDKKWSKFAFFLRHPVAKIFTKNQQLPVVIKFPTRKEGAINPPSGGNKGGSRYLLPPHNAQNFKDIR